MAAPHGKEAQRQFATKIVNGVPEGKAYEEVTGTQGAAASVGASRWMKLPEVQAEIQRDSQKWLLKSGKLAVRKLYKGLAAINPKKMTGTNVNLIKLGMQMSGLLDKKVDVAVNETHTLAPEVLEALKVIGQRTLEAAQELTLTEDGSYAVKDVPAQSDEPGHT